MYIKKIVWFEFVGNNFLPFYIVDFNENIICFQYLNFILTIYRSQNITPI